MRDEVLRYTYSKREIDKKFEVLNHKYFSKKKDATLTKTLISDWLDSYSCSAKLRYVLRELRDEKVTKFMEDIDPLIILKFSYCGKTVLDEFKQLMLLTIYK